MEYNNIVYEVQDAVATITLNRPDSYNALTQPMYREMMHALGQITRDKTVRSVLITGAGKGFCSGADLTEFDLSQDRIAVGDMLRAGLNRIAMTMRSLEKPIICAINGVAAGAGASLTLACDVRLASTQASFVFAAFVNIGIIPDAGATYLLPQLIGLQRAFELVTLSDANNRVSPEQAFSYGLVNRVVPHENLLQEAQAIASRYASMATVAVGMTKRAMIRSSERSLADALEYEAQLQDATFQTEDFREGVAAFLQKRAPKFIGK